MQQVEVNAQVFATDMILGAGVGSKVIACKVKAHA